MWSGMIASAWQMSVKAFLRIIINWNFPLCHSLRTNQHNKSGSFVMPKWSVDAMQCEQKVFNPNWYNWNDCTYLRFSFGLARFPSTILFGNSLLIEVCVLLSMKHIVCFACAVVVFLFALQQHLNARRKKCSKYYCATRTLVLFFFLPHSLSFNRAVTLSIRLFVDVFFSLIDSKYLIGISFHIWFLGCGDFFHLSCK